MHAEGGYVFVARVPEGPIHILDAVGAIIWDEALAGGREDLAERVAKRTDADPTSIRADVEVFVTELTARRLIVEVQLRE